jgi:ATP/maltotriose-dependent transcriptional regulator MalT
VSLGTAARSLGTLAATLGDTHAAARWFKRAATENDRTGALPWAAHARLDHAHLLLAQGDRRAAQPLLDQAAASYRALGMHAWVARCDIALAPA